MQKQWLYLFIILTISSICVSAYFAYSRITFLQNTVTVAGRISSIKKLEPMTGRIEQPAYVPIIEFTDQKGDVYEIESLVRSNQPQDHLIGNSLEVLYEEGKQADAIVKGIWNIWGPTLTFLLLAVLFGLVPIFYRG